MAKNKYLGEDAVLDLFDIITDNFVTKEEFEAREQSIASSIQVGNAFIAAAILRLAEAVAGVKGGEGGDESYDGGDIGDDGDVTVYDGGDVDVDEPITQDETVINDGGNLDEEDEDIVVYDGGEI